MVHDPFVYKMAVRYGLCARCLPAWVTVMPILEMGAQSGPRGYCFYCLTKVPPYWAMLGLDEDGGDCNLYLPFCDGCRAGRVEEARLAAAAAIGLAEAL